MTALLCILSTVFQFSLPPKGTKMTRIKVGNDIVTVSGRNVTIKTGPAPQPLLESMKPVAVAQTVEQISTTGFHTSIINDCIRSER